MSAPAPAFARTAAATTDTAPHRGAYLLQTLPAQILEKRQRFAPRPRSPLRQQVHLAAVDEHHALKDKEGSEDEENKGQEEMKKNDQEEKDKKIHDAFPVRSLTAGANPSPAKPNPFAAYDPSYFADLGIEELSVNFERLIASSINITPTSSTTSTISTTRKRVEAHPHPNYPRHHHPHPHTSASASASMPFGRPHLPPRHQRDGPTTVGNTGFSGPGFDLDSRKDNSLPPSLPIASAPGPAARRPAISRADASSDLSLVSLALAHAQGDAGEGEGGGITASTSIGLGIGLMQPVAEPAPDPTANTVGVGAAASSADNVRINMAGGALALMMLESSSSISRLGAPMVPPRFAAPCGVPPSVDTVMRVNIGVDPSPQEAPMQVLCAPTAVFPDNEVPPLSPSPPVDAGIPAGPGPLAQRDNVDVILKEEKEEENNDEKEVYEGKHLLKSAGAIERWRNSIADTGAGSDVDHAEGPPQAYTPSGSPACLISGLSGFLGVAPEEMEQQLEGQEHVEQEKAKHREQHPLALERRDDVRTANAGYRAEPVDRRGVSRAVSVSHPASSDTSLPSAPSYSGAHTHKFTLLDLACGAKGSSTVAPPFPLPSSIRARKSLEGLGLGHSSTLPAESIVPADPSTMMSTAEECRDIALLARGGDLIADGSDDDADLGSPVVMITEVRQNVRVFHSVPRFARRVLWCIVEEDEEELIRGLRVASRSATNSPVMSGLGIAVVGAVVGRVWSGAWARISSLVLSSPILSSPAGSSEYYADGEREEPVWGVDDPAYDAESLMSPSLTTSRGSSSENVSVSGPVFSGSLSEVIDVSDGAAVEASSFSPAISVSASGPGTVDPAPRRKYTFKFLRRMTRSRSSSSRSPERAPSVPRASSPGFMQHTDAPRGLTPSRFGAAVRRFKGLF